MPTDKFINPKKHPNENDLRKRLGKSYQLIEDVVSALESEYQGFLFGWKFSKTSGWYMTCDRKKRRIFYLFPKEDDFTFRMVLGDKALEEINKGSYPEAIVDMLKRAKQYSEGTLLEFSQRTFEPATIVEFLKAKISN